VRFKFYFGRHDAAKSWSIASALVNIAVRVGNWIVRAEFQRCFEDSVRHLLDRRVDVHGPPSSRMVAKETYPG